MRIEGRGELLGLGSCPGRSVQSLDVVAGRQVLERDIRMVSSWRAKALVTVLEDEELKELKIEDVGATATRAGIWWFRIPVKYDSAPDDRFRRAWPQVAPALLEMLRLGQRVVLHDKDRDGRAGLVACCILAELGLSAKDALRGLRAADKEVQLSPPHEMFVRQYLPHFPEHTRLRSGGPPSA
jgi:ADP-ribosyl-[dinitrogen reductase] hydrolase